MNTFARTISPSAIAAVDGVRVERALSPNGGRYESLAVLEALGSKPRHHLNGGRSGSRAF